MAPYLLIKSVGRVDPLRDKGKPAVRRGRKAADQAMGLTAELPEGW